MNMTCGLHSVFICKTKVAGHGIFFKMMPKRVSCTKTDPDLHHHRKWLPCMTKCPSLRNWQEIKGRMTHCFTVENANSLNILQYIWTHHIAILCWLKKKSSACSFIYQSKSCWSVFWRLWRCLFFYFFIYNIQEWRPLNRKDCKFNYSNWILTPYRCCIPSSTLTTWGIHSCSLSISAVSGPL